MAFMAAIAPVLSAVGSIVGLFGAASQGQAQKQQADYNAQIAANNQTIAQQNAEYARQAGEAKAQQVSLAAAQKLGAVKAAEAASGVDVNSGSNVDVQVGQRQAGNLSALTEENNALLQAYGYEAQASNYGAQSNLYKLEGQNDVNASLLSGAGTALKGVGDLPGKFSAFSGNNGGGNYDPLTGIMYG